MRLYVITLDLLQAAEYESLKTRLRTLGARQLLERQWAVRTTYSAVELKRILKDFIDERDRVVVTEVGSEWASRRALANLGEL
jgi:UDP-N-acetylmuramyl tripeptide synthase